MGCNVTMTTKECKNHEACCYECIERPCCNIRCSYCMAYDFKECQFYTIDNNKKEKEIEKNHKENKMNNIENWTEITRGLYRYVIGAKFCYEIVVLTHCLDTDILTAKANVYAVGTWRDEINGAVFERELLLGEHPVFECIETAIEDYNKNCKED